MHKNNVVCNWGKKNYWPHVWCLCILSHQRWIWSKLRKLSSCHL